MEKQVKYNSLKERAQLVAENEALGLRMLHDNFDADWQHGQEPRGTMIFTDIPAPQAPVEPNYKDLYSKATTQAQKVDIIAQSLGLI